jgi:hypothetical protein
MNIKDSSDCRKCIICSDQFTNILRYLKNSALYLCQIPGYSAPSRLPCSVPSFTIANWYWWLISLVLLRRRVLESQKFKHFLRRYCSWNLQYRLPILQWNSCRKSDRSWCFACYIRHEWDSATSSVFSVFPDRGRLGHEAELLIVFQLMGLGYITFALFLRKKCSITTGLRSTCEVSIIRLSKSRWKEYAFKLCRALTSHLRSWVTSTARESRSRSCLRMSLCIRPLATAVSISFTKAIACFRVEIRSHR